MRKDRTLFSTDHHRAALALAVPCGLLCLEPLTCAFDGLLHSCTLLLDFHSTSPRVFLDPSYPGLGLQIETSIRSRQTHLVHFHTSTIARWRGLRPHCCAPPF